MVNLVEMGRVSRKTVVILGVISMRTRTLKVATREQLALGRVPAREEPDRVQKEQCRCSILLCH
jgi:hypothetical protein